MSDIHKIWSQRFRQYLDLERIQLHQYYLSLTWRKPDEQLDYQMNKVHLILSAHETLWEFFFSTLMVEHIREDAKIYIIDGLRDADYIKKNITMALCGTSPYDTKPSNAKKLKIEQTFQEIKDLLYIQDKEMIATDLLSYFKLCVDLKSFNADILIVNLPLQNKLLHGPLISMLDKIASENNMIVFVNQLIDNVPYYYIPNETDIDIHLNEAMKIHSITSLYKSEMKPKDRWETDLDKKGEDYAQVNIIRNRSGHLQSLEMRMAYRNGVLAVYEE